MKITWFGGTTLRLHIGGSIVVLDADHAPAEIDRQELLSGADIVVARDAAEKVDARLWRPRRASELTDSGEAAGVACLALGEGALLVDAPGERPLVIVWGAVPAAGRWGREAVVVLCGALAEAGRIVVETYGPWLVALAGSEDDIDAAIAALRPVLDGTGLIALDRGMAVEV